VFEMANQQQQIPPQPLAPPPVVPALPPATPATVWALYSEERLQQFLEGLGLDFANANTKAAKVAMLAQIPGLTPSEALVAYQALPRPDQPKVELQLSKQASNETPERFLNRIRSYLQLVNATDTQAITIILNAAQPNVAEFVAEQFQAGTNTTAEMLTRLEERYTPNRYQYYDQFRQYKLTGTQSVREAGEELRRLYLGFQNLTATQAQPHEELITNAVVARLLEILPSSTATTMRQKLLDDEHMAWTDILQQADRLLPSTSKPAPSRRDKAFCKVHGYRGHTDAECQAQGNGPPQSKFGDRKPPVCYSCYQVGHTARDCPSHKKGNATTESA
jgi:hypothetical protein